MRQFRVFICLLLLMSFGCTVFASERGTIIVYKGESENWSIISNVNIVGNNVEYKYTVKYKGENIDSIGRVTYRLDSIVGSLGGASKLDATSNNSRAGKIIGRGGGGNIDLVSKATTIIARVEWNNKLESFELKKQ